MTPKEISRRHFDIVVLIKEKEKELGTLKEELRQIQAECGKLGHPDWDVAVIGYGPLEGPSRCPDCGDDGNY